MTTTTKPAMARRLLGRTVSTGRLLTAPVRALPSFVIIGAQRSGTTTLLSAICQHPLVTSARPTEVHFFDRPSVPSLVLYRQHFPWPRSAIAGESSPYYLAHPDAAGILCPALPEAKLIAILRHPIDRAWSQWRFNVRRGVEPLSFLDAIEAEEDRLAGVDGGGSRLEPVRWHQEYSYLLRGDYAPQLDRFVAAAGRERLLILRSQDLYQEPGPTLRATLAFLGLTPHEVAVGHLNHGGSEQLDSSTRELLRARTASALEELADRYGIVLNELG
ncbi:MAG: sulfotransferase [Actinomycetia bacterium]|nr:sulfotransferase [Actinomycetes bacterium]